MQLETAGRITRRFFCHLLLIISADKIKSIGLISVHGCKSQVLILQFSEICQQCFDPPLVVVSAYSSFWQFEYAVYTVFVLIFLITRQIVIVCVQEKIIDIENADWL